MQKTFCVLVQRSVCPILRNGADSTTEPKTTCVTPTISIHQSYCLCESIYTRFVSAAAAAWFYLLRAPVCVFSVCSGSASHFFRERSHAHDAAVAIIFSPLEPSRTIAFSSVSAAVVARYCRRVRQAGRALC